MRGPPTIRRILGTRIGTVGIWERSDGGFCGGAISTADDDVGFTVCGTGEGLGCGLADSGGAAYEESCWGVRR